VKYIAPPVFLISTPSDGLLDPGTDSLNDSHTRGVRDAEICHGNMRAIALGVAMFYGLEGRYPDSLEELASVDPRLPDLVCPSCSLAYEWDTDGFEGYLLGCPLPEDPDHGYVKDGVPYWPPDPSAWPGICHGNMTTLAAGLAQYFGMYNLYPAELEGLVAEGILDELPVCPECGGYYLYKTDCQTTYTVECPLPSDPNHGWITDGECSWPPDTSGCTEACRSNMCCLATAMAMYYGKENRYPEELRDLGASGIMENWYIPCPACGRIYKSTAPFPGTRATAASTTG